MFSLSPLLQVALGGAAGSVLRHLMVATFGAPWAVMGVNIAGSLIMGVLFIALSGTTLSPLLMTGVLGGFTTFSAFSLDTLKLWEAGRPLTAALYAGGSVLLSLCAVWIGATLARSLS